MTNLTSGSDTTPPVVLSVKAPILTIQYLRGFAALAVVAAHTTTVMMLGQAGVDIFFVISGLIMWTTIQKNSDIGLFAKNRIIRIIPLYWIATIIMGLHQDAGVYFILKSMFFIPYVSDQGEIWPVLVQGWTLNYEMFFYSIILFVLLFSKPIRFSLLLFMIFALSSVGLIFKSDNPIIATYTNPLLIEFCFGIILAELRLQASLPNRYATGAFALIGACLAWVYASHALPTTYRFLVWGGPSALLVATALSVEAARPVRRIGVLLVIGDASYAIYLFHTFALKTVVEYVSRLSLGLDTVAVIAVSTAVGVLITIFVENPLLNAFRRRGKVAHSG